MKAMPNEPSMEEILSSIKRIIAEEDVPVQGARAPRRATTAPARATTDEADHFADDDQILELTEALTNEADSDTGLEEEAAMAMSPRPSAKAEAKPVKAARARPAVAAPAAQRTAAPAVMSDTSADAARESLVNLSKLLIRSDDGPSNTLEGLVREMLRPMLKEWLDAHLPELVESMVKREIDRITGRV